MNYQLHRELEIEAAAKVKTTDEQIADWYREKGEEQRECRKLIRLHGERHPDCNPRCWERQALEQRLASANMGD